MKQGEIWLVNLDPAVGAEIRKTRPCVIVSDDAIGVLPLKVIAPLTDYKDRYARVPWMVPLTPESGNNLEKPSALDCFQVRCVSEARLVRKVGAIDAQQLTLAREALQTVFGIR